MQRYMQQHNQVELSALGMAIATVVTIAEILKNNGLAVEKICGPFSVDDCDSALYIRSVEKTFVEIMTSMVNMNEESRARPIQKAKIEILLEKTNNFDELMAAAVDERDAADGL
ncbi:uncharacterized protein At2g34160-like isoform X3 [Ananas comosus]|uniref:Uncharacterized protein At2g34160-like isoform X3 n=1 Tax=Ananas comosus TaxID=4615 RepID=A0A6P5FW26_ANACO|nr:uncharacterized protein At2g34160-like isoform X3 [Ananas comosus]